ncbi:MAG: glycine cleavage system protein GcvH [Planctomycetes bacterium]|nr:glycine cleavage system protein GcvH [Planctomycetota bacterium]
MAVPNDRKYRETHEWFKADGNVVTVGVSQFAADELTDVTYVELPEVGATLEADGQLGEVESVKATSEMYCAVSGKVVEVNGALEDQPELVNTDPFGEGWMIKVEASDLADVEKLLSAAEYDKKYTE